MKTLSKATLNTMIAGAMATTMTSGFASQVQAAEKEKCYGVVKAGHNLCANASGTHSCAGMSTVDGDGGEWISLPKGVCEKLVGGSLTPYEGTEPPEEKTNEG